MNVFLNRRYFNPQPRNATAQCNRAMQPRNIAQGILLPFIRLLPLLPVITQ